MRGFDPGGAVGSGTNDGTQVGDVDLQGVVGVVLLCVRVHCACYTHA